ATGEGDRVGGGRALLGDEPADGPECDQQDRQQEQRDHEAGRRATPGELPVGRRRGGRAAAGEVVARGGVCGVEGEGRGGGDVRGAGGAVDRCAVVPTDGGAATVPRAAELGRAGAGVPLLDLRG